MTNDPSVVSHAATIPKAVALPIQTTFLDTKRLEETVSMLDLAHKGIHAADESGGNIQDKFAKLRIPYTDDNLIAYRGAMMTTPGYADAISGVILFEETLGQRYEGESVPEILKRQGVLIGVKVDKGLTNFGQSTVEKVANDELEALPARLRGFSDRGARFAKFRVIANIGTDHDGTPCPTDACLRENAILLAGYAKACQQEGIVPIVEPEIPMEKASHSVEECQDATRRFLEHTFRALAEANVYLPGVILKVNMIVPGTGGPQVSDAEIANRSLAVFEQTVPHDIGGIVFLSGGQSAEEANRRLKLTRELASGGVFSDRIGSSFSRALQGSALEAFGAALQQSLQPGEIKNAIQSAFSQSLQLNAAAFAQ